MSRIYKHGEEVPNEVLAKRLDELSNVCTESPFNSNQFSMRIPAELDRDADLVLSEAASRLRQDKTAEIVELVEVMRQDACGMGLDLFQGGKVWAFDKVLTKIKALSKTGVEL